MVGNHWARLGMRVSLHELPLVRLVPDRDMRPILFTGHTETSAVSPGFANWARSIVVSGSSMDKDSAPRDTLERRIRFARVCWMLQVECDVGMILVRTGDSDSCVLVY